MPLIYIVLVNYNSYKDTIECVNSLKKVNYNNYKIIIVDNLSTDDSIKYLKSELQDCIIIESKENLGFAGGNNIGIKYALENGAEFVLLLNNDTLVERNLLSNMIIPFKENQNIGVVGCKIMYSPQVGTIWFGGGKIDWFKFIGEHFGMGEEDKSQYNLEREIDFMTGCCMLIRNDIFQKVGFLSEEYFMYFEDVDFCVKVKEAGYKIWYNPQAMIFHKVGLSGGGEDSAFSIEWCTRNRLIFMNKYKGKVNFISLLLSKIFFYSTRVVRYSQFVLEKDYDKAKAIKNGIKSARKFLKNNH